MNKKIKIKDKEISYKIKKSQKAKRLRLAVYCDMSVVVVAPKGAGESLVEKFLIQKANWLLDKIDFFSKLGKSPVVKNSKEDFLRKKKEAYALVKERVDFFNEIYGFDYNKIIIKNQKTIWGSCSAKKNLNFNYKIVYLPPDLVDYVIVHELCHLQEFNHSKKFWNLITKALPGYYENKKQLKERLINIF